MVTTQRSSFDLPALDPVLGSALNAALRAGRPSASVVLAVLARALDQNVAPGRVRVWLRSRCKDADVLALVGETTAWRTLVAGARRHAAESPSQVRVRIARRMVASLLRPLPAGEAALVAVLGLSMLDDENGWDSALISKRLSVTLGIAHNNVSGRVRRLVDQGVLTMLSRGRGVPGRVRFAKLSPTVSKVLEDNPRAVALVTLLSAEDASGDAMRSSGAREVVDTVALLRSVSEPAIGYGDALSDAAWQYALLHALDADDVLPKGRRTRARKVLRDAGIDPDDLSLFADAVRDLSYGEPTRLRDEREAQRVVEATERAQSAEEHRARKARLYERTLPALEQRAGAIPSAPTTSAQQMRAKEWVGKMRAACASAIGTPMEAPLRTALRGALVRRGWSADDARKVLGIILPAPTKEVTS